MAQEPNDKRVRPQFLTTEHWSLLATRSQTWSEVMGRITTHFTFASASLVVLALTVQVSGVDAAFRVLAIGLGIAVLATGSLTSLRVRNASEEDLMLVEGMNRLRGAYVEMDPSVANYLITGWTDNEEGIARTYSMGVHRTRRSQFLASAFVFVGTVNTVVAAGLGAVLANSAGASGTVSAIFGVVAALLYAGLVVFPEHWGYRLLSRGSDADQAT
jgi:hypothetical protein